MEDKTSKFSAYHPVIPKLYTPAWKIDMSNRARIVENCKLAGVPYQPTEASLYINKRERISQDRPEDSACVVETKTSREKLLRPPLYSHLSKYQSSLMSRYI